MIDKKLYQETFSRLRASDEAKKEVLLKMNEMKAEKTMRRPWRALRAAGLAAMLTLALAVTANAASGGELLEGIYQTFAVTFTTTDGGETFTVNVGGVSEGAVEGLFSAVHGSAVTTNRDGRLFLIVGEEETDITDALTKDGQYTATLEDGTEITVQGTVEDHMILSSAEDSDMFYITTSTRGDVHALDGMEVNVGEENGTAASSESMASADADVK